MKVSNQGELIKSNTTLLQNVKDEILHVSSGINMIVADSEVLKNEVKYLSLIINCEN